MCNDKGNFLLNFPIHGMYVMTSYQNLSTVHEKLDQPRNLNGDCFWQDSLFKRQKRLACYMPLKISVWLSNV